MDFAAEPVPLRHIEIEVDDLERGLPCRVIDREPPDSGNILWHANFEEGFCRRKAEETRFILQAQGWACRPESADERRDRAARRFAPPFIVAAWRCLEGVQPLQQLTNRPPLPTARPSAENPAATVWGNELLRAAVRRDLAVIGQDKIGDQTAVDAALGDLNSDGIEDAIVILTRKTGGAAPHRMLMAYLQNGEAYNLVDVWILMTPDGQDSDEFDLTIKDGAVHLSHCCEDQIDPTILILDDRKLAYANGS